MSYTIKEYNPHHGGSVKYFNNYDTHEEAEKDLAYWLSRHGCNRNSDTSDKLKLEYGTYTAPTQEQLEEVYRNFRSYGYEVGDLNDEDAQNLKESYNPKEDSQWYEWPEHIEGYSYDSVSWTVVERV